ncbi:hypothetical protein GCM10023311_22450 [Flaviramulus aquimarinus]|uniref:N-acetyltransferase domain-containing protein n=1 Tax=Flaviramulus aquimarinus TaxID=1170456 RepID=A0ABP9F988_9FLAO
MIKLIRTNSDNVDFINLVNQLDTYLKIVDGKDHAFYNQYNNIDVLKNTVVAYINEIPIGCGAFKPYNTNTVEIKRMFTLPESREKGIASLILKELENWANELGYKYCVLETGKRQVEAVCFYDKMHYTIISNFGPYKNVSNSLCFQKKLI